jgi:hypothetical protein
MYQLIQDNPNLITYTIKRGGERIQKLIELVGDRGFIAGSYAAHMASVDHSLIIQPNDIDIFAISDAAADAICTDLCQAGMFPEQSNSIVTTLAPSQYKPICDMNIQVIKPNPIWQNFPDDIIHSFDLNVCKAILIDGHIIGDIEIGSTIGRVLRVANPLRTIRRIMKYQSRGVQFDDWELVKTFLAWDELSEERVQEITASAQPEEETVPYDWYDADDYFDAE